MVLKIGKYFFCSLFFAYGMCAQEPTLTMVINSLHGKPQQELIAGKRALLEVTVTSDEQTSEPITVEHLDVFELSQQGSQSLQMTSINGKTTYTRRQQYIVASSKLGMLTVGPAYIERHGKRIYASAFSIPVVESPTDDESSSDEEKLTMIFDKERYLVGERIGLTVRLEYSAVLYSLFLEPLQLKDFYVVEVASPKQGTITKGGTECGYMEWQYELQAKKPGTYVLPSARATYQIARNRSAHQGFMQQFFGPTLETASIESISPTLHIESIPNLDTSLPVGVYRHFAMKANAHDTNVGEPITVSLSVEGDGALHFLPLALQGLEKSVQAYESRKEVQTVKGVAKRVVEYIVQPTQAGMLTIPEQEFTAYNPQTKRMYTLKAPALSIQVAAFVAHSAHAKKTMTRNVSTLKPLPVMNFLIVMCFLQLLGLLLWYRAGLISIFSFFNKCIGLFWWRLTARRKLILAFDKNDYARARLILDSGVYRYGFDKLYETAYERYYHLLMRQGLSAECAHSLIKDIEQLQYAQPGESTKVFAVSSLLSSWRLFFMIVLIIAHVPIQADEQVARAVSASLHASSLQEVTTIFASLPSQGGFDDFISLIREQAIGRLWLGILSFAPLIVWQVFVALMIALMFWCVYARKKIWFGSLQAFVFMVSLVFLRVEYLKFFEYGIVPSRTAFYNGPSRAYGEQFTTQTMHLAVIKSHDHKWSLVECPAGTGWIPTNSYWLMHVE